MLKLLDDWVQKRNKKILKSLIYQEVKQDSKAEQKTIELYQLIRTCLNETFYNDSPYSLDKYSYNCFKKSQIEQNEKK